MKGFSLSAGQKTIIWLLGASLVTVFIASLTYRMNHPGNKVEYQQEGGKGGMPGGMASVNEDAMKHVRELMARMRKDPDNMEIQLELANSFMMIRAYDRAKPFFDKVLTKEPDNVQALMGLGMCYYQAENFKEAAGAFDRIIALDPDDSMARFNTGIIKKYYLHEHEAAENEFRQIISNPKSPDDMKRRAEEELKKEPVQEQ